MLLRSATPISSSVADRPHVVVILAEDLGNADLGYRGSAIRPPGSNGTLRGGKGTLHEGGVREPTIVNGPARLAAREVNEPLHMVNVMPTLLTLAGAQGRSVFDPDFDIDDGGLPHEKAVLPST